MFLDLKVSNDQKKPCESAHEITLSLSQPNYIKPLLLSFPYPFLVDSIRASLHYAHRSISLVLNKAIQEPWPFELENHLKWKADDLQPWKETKKKLSDHLTHLSHQFNFYHLKNPSLMEDTALNAFRVNIATLYSSSNDFLCIQLKGSSKLNPGWYLRLHKPILTSPLNSPIVLLSAFHNQLTEKHTSKEKSDRNKAGKAFFGIFPDYKLEETPVKTLEITDKECLQLWRFILRLNSTKIEPSSWQKKHLPLGENSHDDHSHHCGAMVDVSPMKQILHSSHCIIIIAPYEQHYTKTSEGVYLDIGKRITPVKVNQFV